MEKNGGVYIKGEESSIKNGRRQANVKCAAQGHEKVVIVGGSVLIHQERTSKLTT
jgi:hypothetical protein